MSLASIRKKGYLYKLPVKGFVKKWNRRWFVLRGTNIEGIVRLEYFDNESYEATAMGKRTIPLRQCRDLSPTGGTKTHPYVFQFTTPMGHHVFAADTHTDMEEWMSAMQEAIAEDKQRNRRKKTQSLIVQQPPERSTQSLSTSGMTEVPVAIKHPELTTQNDPYEPSNSGTYRVTLELNESAKRLKFTGMIYNLDITPENITLITADSGADVAQWQYRQIRTYGKSSGKFNFECGRGASTGPGNFVFKTTCSKEIFGIVHRNIKRIRTQIEQEGPERAGSRPVSQIPKQASLPEQLQPTKSPTKKDDHTANGYQPMKPIPYKPKKRMGKSMSVGTYRHSREFGNPPSYEEISAAEPVKEEKKKEKPTDKPTHEEQKVPDGLYATVDKSKKKEKVAAAAKGVKPGSADKSSSHTVQSSASNTTSEALTTSTAANDPFHPLPASSSPVKQDREENSSEDPFQLDPFLFSPQLGANSFDIVPGADPFTIPLPPTDTQAATMPNVFDDLGQLDSSAGGEFDIFNFGPPIIGTGPSTNRASNLPSLAGNPAISDANNPSGLNFDLDLLDDRLFDTLAQLEVQDDREKKEDLAAKGKRRVNDEFDFSYQLPQPPSGGQAAGATASGNRQKKLTKQEFDNLWDGICATMPTTDS